MKESWQKYNESDPEFDYRINGQDREWTPSQEEIKHWEDQCKDMDEITNDHRDDRFWSWVAHDIFNLTILVLGISAWYFLT
mgnify:CR=1 FL=1|tara:strand:+ start:4481 stop:4723 length:243 start_codon:yes stop_codon:yes gene_type:complete